MKRGRITINKISVPELPKVVPRKRLFRMLDERQHYKVTWVSGMAGSGKTTLAASYLAARNVPCLWYRIDEGDIDLANFFYYLGMATKKATPRKRKPLPLLTPEYFPGVSVFSQRYFENLSARLTAPFFIVFDDYHTVPLTAQFHNVFRDGLLKLSPDIHTVILSRADPPPAFARMLANNVMRIIGPNDLRLNLDESKKIVEIESGISPPAEIIEQIHEKIRGWAAGLILMTKSIKAGDTTPEFSDTFTPTEIFDYLTSEILDKMEESTREFLLKTAFLPRITVSIAQDLTGRADSGRILSSLRRNHILTEKLSSIISTYQYHPLFREFLISRAGETFDRDEISRLKKRSAELLEASEQMEEAIDLYHEAGDMENYIRLIHKQAKDLIAQGRNRTLEQWIRKIHEDILKNNPWLLYWLGVSCQHFSAAEARGYFESAFYLFERRQDMDGLYLSWTGIIDSIAYEWNYFTEFDQWIEWLDNRICSGHSFPSRDIEAKVTVCMMCALVIRNPERPDIIRWVEQALSLSRKSGNINLRILAIDWAMMYYSWIGDFARTETIRDESKELVKSYRTSPAMMIHWKWIDISTRLSTMTDIEAAQAEISEALDLVNHTGLHVWEHIFFMPGIFASLLMGEFSKAEYYLKRFESILDNAHFHGYAVFHHFAGLYNLLTGNGSRALAQAETAVKLSDETGYVLATIVCRIQLAYVLHEQGKSREALKELSQAHSKAHETKSSIYTFMCLIVKSKITMDQGKDEEGIELLRDGLSLGRIHNYMNMIWWWHPTIVSQLCERALMEGIEVEYVKKLIRAHKLVPESPPYHIENWPWALKIHTFDRFQIIKDGKPLRFEGKTQTRPIELLKVLIACGGIEISVENIIDALWYEADGDMAQSAFSTTLNRLRKLIGHKEAIQLQDGKLTIDQKYCWMDTRAFSNTLNEADDLWKRGKKKEAVDLYEKAITIYAGHFLAEESGKPWIIPTRERLKNLFLTAVTKLGMFREQEKEFEKATGYYMKGLAVDNLEESFYRRLMECYYNLGRHADAVKVYRRCRDTLATVLDVDPSEETAKIYKMIKSPGTQFSMK